MKLFKYFLILSMISMLSNLSIAQESVTQVQDNKKSNQESSVLLGGLAYFGLQNWSRVGSTGDSKMGFGFGGDLLAGAKIDETLKVYAGPHIGLNRWSADYSGKAYSATDSVYVNMNDMGVVMLMDFNDTYFHLGAGSSTISSAMVVGGKEIEYNYSGRSYDYKSFGIGIRYESMLLGLSGVQYDGFASAADRVEFNFGWGAF